MQLHQINAQYDVAQDRLLLRISTRDRLEYRLWLTRRITALLWPGLFRLLESSEPVRRQAYPDSQQAMLEFQHEHALQQTDFSQSFDADALTPALPEPLLVHKVQMRRSSEQLYVLLFSPPEGPGLQIQLPEKMVHALAKLIADGVKAANWGLSAPGPTQPRAPATGNKLN